MTLGNMYNCTRCRYAGPYSLHCPVCGNSNTMKPRQLELLQGGASPTEPSPPPTPDSRSDDSIMPIRVRTSPLDRIQTGLGTLDVALGGGFVRSSSALLAGDWGSGKSTLALRLADSIKHCLYVASEENREQVEDRATRTGRAIGCPLLCTKSVERILRALIDIKSRQKGLDKIDMMIIDSFDGLIGRKIEIARDLERLCHDMRIALLAVSQVVKDGSVSGPNELGHIFDTVLVIEKTDNQIRQIVCEKSRFAASPVRYPLLLSELGWVEVPLPTQENTVEDTGTADNSGSGA
jgi:predicted ATP-dependent serine protease